MEQEIAEMFAELGGSLTSWWSIAKEQIFAELLAQDEPNEIVWH